MVALAALGVSTFCRRILIARGLIAWVAVTLCF
jgi:hypothetical protein